MKVQYFLVLYLFFWSLTVCAGPYDTPAMRGAQWLSSKQNMDGSWGNSPNLQAVYTSVAVNALDKAYQRENAYFAGITWLENNASNNVDSLSRLADSLSSHGDNLFNISDYLQNAQESFKSGWGLSAIYTSSAIDTAFALIAYDKLNKILYVQSALDFMKSAQRLGPSPSDKGWSVGTASASDPTITALAVQALSRYVSIDPSLNTVISNALSTLNAIVLDTAPVLHQAMVAQAAQDAGNTTIAAKFLNSLISTQSADGSWGADPYVTALATRALATAAQSSIQATTVTVPDQQLRRAINLALGRNAMDSLNRGELAQLTSLTAINAGISSLVGLEWAINLTSVNFNNNNLTSIAELSGLTKLTSISWTGNPGNPGAALAKSSSQIKQQAPPISLQAIKQLKCRRSRYLGNC